MTMLLDQGPRHFALYCRALALVERYAQLGIDQFGVGDMAGTRPYLSQAYHEFMPEVRTASRRVPSWAVGPSTPVTAMWR